MKKNWFQNFVDSIERYLPMSFNSLLIFLFVLYLFFIVGRSIYNNYRSNKDIDVEKAEVFALQDQVTNLNNEINYYQTQSYKEMQAREKLGYKAPGEKVISLPLDKEEDNTADPEIGEVQIKTPNPYLWWDYFFED